MKTKIFLCFLALIMMCLSIVGCGEKMPAMPKGTYDISGEPIDMLSIKRGMNVSALEREEAKGWIGHSVYGWVYKKETYENIKNAGFDHIRLPVNFALYYSNGKINEDLFDDVDGIINTILDLDMSVVLDFHGWWGTIDSDVGKYKEQLYDIWEQVAEHYKDYPYELLFQILNEPYEEEGPDPLNASNLNEIQPEVIKIIRKTNPKRIIVASGPEWSTWWGLENLVLPENDPNIIVDVHTYQPMDFTHQGTEVWEDPNAQVEQVRIYGEVFDEIDKVVKACREFTKRTGIKTWLGEFGLMVEVAASEDVTKYLKYVTDSMEKADIPWAYWEYNGDFGAYNKSKGKWRDYVLDALIK